MRVCDNVLCVYVVCVCVCVRVYAQHTRLINYLAHTPSHTRRLFFKFHDERKYCNSIEPTKTLGGSFGEHGKNRLLEEGRAHRVSREAIHRVSTYDADHDCDSPGGDSTCKSDEAQPHTENSHC